MIISDEAQAEEKDKVAEGVKDEEETSAGQNDTLTSAGLTGAPSDDPKEGESHNSSQIPRKSGIFMLKWSLQVI